jgi:hypothetical protein
MLSISSSRSSSASSFTSAKEAFVVLPMLTRLFDIFNFGQVSTGRNHSYCGQVWSGLQVGRLKVPL